MHLSPFDGTIVLAFGAAIKDNGAQKLKPLRPIYDSGQGILSHWHPVNYRVIYMKMVPIACNLFPSAFSKRPFYRIYISSSPGVHMIGILWLRLKRERPQPTSSEQWLRSRFIPWVWQWFSVWPVEAQAPVQTKKIQLLWRHRGCSTPCCSFPQWESLPSWIWLSNAGWKWFGTLWQHSNLAARLKMNKVKTRNLMSKRSMRLTAQCFLKDFWKCMWPMTAASFIWIASTCRVQTLLIENSECAKIAQLSFAAESCFASYSARMQSLPWSAVFWQMTSDNAQVTGPKGCWNGGLGANSHGT